MIKKVDKTLYEACNTPIKLALYLCYVKTRTIIKKMKINTHEQHLHKFTTIMRFEYETLQK